MSDIKKEISALMAAVRKKRLPSSEAIVDETFKKLQLIPNMTTPENVQRNFNQIFKQVWLETLRVLEDYEESVYPSNIIDALIGVKSDVVERSKIISQSKGYRQAVKFLFVSLYPYLREIFLSISQSRKARGGKDFELQFGRLLELMNIPYQKFNRAYRVDFMLPSDDLFKKNPTAAAIVSAKRTLRERWREVVEELHAMRSPNIFLATADPDVAKGHVKGICGDYRIHLVVWDEIKEKYSREPLVLGYTQWANDRIPILRKFWQI
jgi:hypothetical protein